MPESTDITAEFDNTLAPPMLTTRHTLLHRLLIAGSALLALAWMGLIIFSGPRILTGENHTSYDIRYLWCLSAIAAPIALAGLLSGHTRKRRTTTSPMETTTSGGIATPPRATKARHRRTERD